MPPGVERKLDQQYVVLANLRQLFSATGFFKRVLPICETEGDV